MRNTTCQFQTIIAALKDGKCMNNDIYIALMVFKMPLASPCNDGQSWVPQDANKLLSNLTTSFQGEYCTRTTS
jgi:hypothetical protein